MESVSITIPIDTRKEEEGTIEYKKGGPSDTARRGVFSFVFYIPLNVMRQAEEKDSNVYRDGIVEYVKAVRNPAADNPFQGWKVVIYTDNYTYEQISTWESFRIPEVELAIVKWPFYQKRNSIASVNGDILRTLRLKALFDFPRIPVFIRDADTIFDKENFLDIRLKLFPHEQLQKMSYEEVDKLKASIPSLFENHRAEFSAFLYEWEKQFYLAAMSHPNTFLFGTSPGYKEDWHLNTLSHEKAPLGAYAGFLNSIPSVPCFQTQEGWHACIDYLKARSKKLNQTRRRINLLMMNSDAIENSNKRFIEYTNEQRQNFIDFHKKWAKNKPKQFTSLFNKRYNEFKSNKDWKDFNLYKNLYHLYSNENQYYKLGRDEQLVVFVLLPLCREHTFFYNLAFKKYTGFTDNVYNVAYPPKGFGFHNEIAKIFPAKGGRKKKTNRRKRV